MGEGQKHAGKPFMIMHLPIIQGVLHNGIQFCETLRDQ